MMKYRLFFFVKLGRIFSLTFDWNTGFYRNRRSSSQSQFIRRLTDKKMKYFYSILSFHTLVVNYKFFV